MMMPLIALPLFVMERANKKAGAPLPKIPVSKTTKYFSRGMVRNAQNKKGVDARNEMLTRKHANSIGEKRINPFLMRI